MRNLIKKHDENINTIKIAFLGGLLILINAVIIAVNSSPVIISTDKPNPIEILWSDSAPFWFRLAFGLYDYSKGAAAIFGIVMASTILFCVSILYLKPQHRKFLSTIIMGLAVMMFLYGGGFIIGSIMTFISAGTLYESPKKTDKTFISSLLKTLKFDKEFFAHIKKAVSPQRAVKVILLANFLSGVGNSLYTFNVQKILTATSDQTPYEVLINAKMYSDIAIASAPIMLMGLGVIKWMLLVMIFFGVIKMFRWKASLGSIATLIGFAYTPITLQLFTPILFTSKPYLTTVWPFTVFLISNLWMVALLIFGLKILLEISSSNSIVIVALSLSIYAMIAYLIFDPIKIPYTIMFQIEPIEVLLSLMSLIIMITALMLKPGKV